MRKLLIAAALSFAVTSPVYAMSYDDMQELRMLTRQYLNARSAERGARVSSDYTRSYNGYVPSRSYSNDNGLSSSIPSAIPPVHTYQFGGHQTRCQTFDNALGGITYCN